MFLTCVIEKKREIRKKIKYNMKKPVEGFIDQSVKKPENS